MSTARASPRAISLASSFTRSWGKLPPTVVVMVVRGSMPRRRPTSAPGSGYFHDTMSTTAIVSSMPSTERGAPESASAARAASARRSMGSRACAGSSGCCVVWPAPTTTGVRGSIYFSCRRRKLRLCGNGRQSRRRRGAPKLPLRGQGLGQVVLDRGPHRAGRCRALGTDRAVPAGAAKSGVTDALEVLLAPDGLGHGSQLFFDAVELLTVGLQRLRIVDRLGGQALVAHAKSQAAPNGHRREQPRL